MNPPFKPKIFYCMKNRLILAITTCFFIINSFNCNKEITRENTNIPKAKNLEAIEKVLEEHTSYLMTIPGVVGTAISDCDGELCIKVLVKTLSEEIEMKIPRSIQGYNVIIEEVGDIRAF